MAAAPAQLPAGLWSRCNAVSVDAVAVGLLWQALFTVQFCGRLPRAHEALIIGGTIWLVYTADRLLDVLRFDPTRPHTRRHRFHYEHRESLTHWWLVVLTVDCGLICAYAGETQLRWGCAVAGLVVAYVVGVQCVRRPPRWLPKEIQAGMVFALGTSLVAWADSAPDNLGALALATFLAAGLFGCNCAAIAVWEQPLDRQQRFHSLATRGDAPVRLLLPAAALTLVTVTAIATGRLPPLVGGCLVVSQLLLIGLIRLNRPPRPLVANLPLRVAMADWVLILPPALSPLATWWA